MEKRMMHKFRITLLLIIFAIPGVSSVLGQGAAEGIEERRITLKVIDQPLGKVFEKLINQYDIAIGFEESLLDKEHDDYKFEPNIPPQLAKRNDVADESASPKILASISVEWNFNVTDHLITVEAENQELRSVLDNIVGQMKYYQWEIMDGVVNIFPSQARDPHIEHLLELQIESFSLWKDAPLWVIRPRIIEMPEVQTYLNENKLMILRSRLGPKYLNRDIGVELKIENVGMRDLLNKITKEKRGGWIIKNKKVKPPEGKNAVIELLL